MGGITSVFGVGGLTGGDTSGPVQISIDNPLQIGNGGTGGASAANARNALFSFLTNNTGDIYYRAATGIQRLPVGAQNQVLTVNASLIPQWMASQGSGGGSGPGAVTNPMQEDLLAGGHNITGVLELGTNTIKLSSGSQTGVLSIDSSTGELKWNGGAIIGGGAQTPWLTDIDADSHDLKDVGRVGIGTDTPSEALHIVAEVPAGPRSQIFIEPGAANAHSAIGLRSTYLGTQQDWLVGSGVDWPLGWPISNNFHIQNLTLGSEPLTIASASSFVGINNNTPVWNLDVGGDINVSGSLRINGQNILEMPGIANPWTGDIDADGWNLLRVGQISTQYLTFCNDVDLPIDVQMLNGRMDVSGGINATAYFQNGQPLGGQWTNVPGGIIYSVGKVGIGTFPTAPSTTLSTGQNLAPIKLALYDWGNPSTTALGIGAMSGPPYNQAAITFGVDILPDTGTPQMVLTVSGNLGIGTINPTARIEVIDAVSPYVSHTRVHSDSFYMAKSRGTETAPTSVQTGDYIGYVGYGGFVTGIGYADGATIQAVVTGVTANGVSAALAFATSNGSNTSASEAMRLTAQGRLGIGMTNPQYTIDVTGDVNVTGDFLHNNVPLTSLFSPLLGRNVAGHALLNVSTLEGLGDVPVHIGNIDVGGSFIVYHELDGASILVETESDEEPYSGIGFRTRSQKSSWSLVAGGNGTYQTAGENIDGYLVLYNQNIPRIPPEWWNQDFDHNPPFPLYISPAENIGMGHTPDDRYKLTIEGDLNITGTYRINGAAFGAPDPILQTPWMSDIHADHHGLYDVDRVYAETEIAVFTDPEVFLAFNHELLVTSENTLNICTDWIESEHVTLTVNSEGGNGLVQAHENLLTDAALFIGHYEGGVYGGEWYSSMMYLTPDGIGSFHPSDSGDLDPHWVMNMYGDFVVSNPHGESMRIDQDTGDVHITGHLFVNGNQIA